MTVNNIAQEAPSKGFSRTLIVVGAVVAVVALGAGASASFWSSQRGSASLDADMTGVTAIELDSSGANIDVEFADVEVATLNVVNEGSPGYEWKLTTENGVLRVAQDEPWFSWSFQSKLDDITLLLPEEFRDAALDLEINHAGGAVEIAGSFGDITAVLDGGMIDLDGAASALNLEVNGGFAELALDDLRTAEIELSGGRVDAEISGEQPRDITASVTAGTLDLIVPQGSYNTVLSQLAGSIDNQLDVDSKSESRIRVDLVGGSATLTAED
ncbi:DUF4097 family beta strand repeat-containing protein [Humidisolicoccus flavus]|uniref:DUF4097 family beta strand repeat-containing protein n=1 Tax=Humidisolicoccus flavus TaxID=3111414 RepID=UPI003254FF4D